MAKADKIALLPGFEIIVGLREPSGNIVAPCFTAFAELIVMIRANRK
jgi:hypothetical protein